MKVKLKKGKVIALRKGRELIRYDDSSEPFDVEESIGRSLIASRSASLVVAEEKLCDSETDYHSMKVEELRKLAEEKGLDSTGKKDELIARIAGDKSDI